MALGKGKRLFSKTGSGKREEGVLKKWFWEKERSYSQKMEREEGCFTGAAGRASLKLLWTLNLSVLFAYFCVSGVSACKTERVINPLCNGERLINHFLLIN